MTGPAGRAVLSALAPVVSRIGLLGPLSVACAYARRQPAFQILTYHRVNDDNDPFFEALPTSVFERHMAFVARTYVVLTVEELAERMRACRVPRLALAITFDDGYRDTLTHAAPILARYGLPATVFLATGLIDRRVIPWVDRLALAIKASRADGCVVPGGERVTFDGIAGRLRALARALHALKRLPHAELAPAFEGLLEQIGAPDDTSLKDLMLSWDDVHALTGLGFSIAAHTVNHPILSRLPVAQAREEIVQSRQMIECALGTPPRAFAYPNGGAEDYTSSVVALVREAGFTCAVTTRFGVNTPITPLFELRRGGPWERALPLFALKLAAHRWVGGRGTA